ncbi:hypothetical protein KKB10_04095 [Patescibacteria group bacterium]|nr:hypothetical protein [Patescibacteria group bacterium]MBU1075428.1 hypothetical protein [Patescibacteria group bacterium]MBU1952482.1 hypothetical protein [Patescibacteria group bacterium]MBU2235694.1 hypothetical protein [Patescibacteria group bacterium]
MIGAKSVTTHEQLKKQLRAAARVCMEQGCSIDHLDLPWFIQLGDGIVARRNSNSFTARPYFHLYREGRMFANLVLPSITDYPGTPWELQVLDTYMLAGGRQLAGTLLAMPEIKESQIDIVEFDIQDKQRPIHEFTFDILV